LSFFRSPSPPFISLGPSPFRLRVALSHRGALGGTARQLTFMPSPFTDSQVLVLKSMRIPPFAESMIDQCDCSSSVLDTPAYRRSFNMPPIMDKGSGQGEHASFLESPMLRQIANIVSEC
jgi:hypothetical protein